MYDAEATLKKESHILFYQTKTQHLWGAITIKTYSHIDIM